MKTWSRIWKGNRIPALIIIILVLVWHLGRQILDIESILNEYRSVIYICVNISEKVKIIVQKPWKAFGNNLHDHHDAKKTIAKAYWSISECFVQETAYHIFPELKLLRIKLLCILLTPTFQRKEFKYYFIKENLRNYQIIDQIFLRDQILIVTWKAPRKILQWKIQCFKRFLLWRILSILQTWKNKNQVRPTNMNKMN